METHSTSLLSLHDYLFLLLFFFLDCFGGTGVLTYSFLGATDVVGAVSFHGGLTDFPVTGPINHPVLVLSGGADDTGTEVEVLEATLVSWHDAKIHI